MTTTRKPDPSPVPRLAGGRVRRALARGVPALAIAAAASAMLLWTWGTWADPVIDFGQQLYTAWQLSLGKVLYRDVAFYNGPLSQYVNSLWFRLFGVSLRTLVCCNLAIAVGLTLLLHAMLRRVTSRVSAGAACLVFVLLFAMGGFAKTGNYNYLCPYSHEMTHGVALSLLALLCIWGYRRRGLAALAGGGLALGLAFLTKAEVFVAAGAGAAVAMALTLWAERPPWRRALGMVGTLAATALAPPAAAFALLAAAMPARAALTGTLGSWVVATNPELTSLPFYQGLTGLTNIGPNLAEMGRYAMFYAAVLVPAGLVAWATRRMGPRATPRGRFLVALCVFCVSVAVTSRLVAPPGWLHAAQPLPLVLLVVGEVLLFRFARREGDLESRRRVMRQVSLVALALVMMSKMILGVWIGHYGFVLAMPAAMVLVVLLLDWLPAAVRWLGGDGPVMAAAGAGMLVAAVVAYLGIQGQRLAEKTAVVAPGTADAFRCGPAGNDLNDFVRDFSSLSAPGQTLAVLPEGAMLNYLCRRESSVPYVNFMPLEVALYGEETMRGAFQSRPPDWIALTSRETDEYGVEWFADYGLLIKRWVGVNYVPARAGARSVPRPDQGLGIVLLKKIP